MDEAFVENSQHQVDDEDGHQQQHPESAQGILESLRGALDSCVVNVAGRVSSRELLHLVERLASDTPGARSKEIVTAGNCPEWLIASGPSCA